MRAFETRTSHFCDRNGRTGERILKDDFLEWLRAHGSFEGISMRAIPEGRVVHPNVTLTVISGPLAMAQILETPLLNMLNFQTLIATKAARIREAARGRTLLEFGMRRAHERGANAGRGPPLSEGRTAARTWESRICSGLLRGHACAQHGAGLHVARGR
jgi:nicotinate phosphoribosyltransferase